MAVDHLLFRQNTWFRRLTPETIAELAAHAIVRRLANGELWISRTERASGLAIIVQGGLRSTTFTEDGREYVFSIMKKGEIWGLVSTIDGTHNANDVYAHGETTIVSIRRQVVLKTMDARPDFSRCVLEILCHRLRMANAILEDRALKPIDVRLARLLLSLRGPTSPSVPRNGKRTTERIAITQEMLAKILSCTRPTVNKQLKRFEQAGLLKVEYGAVFLKNVARLQNMSGSGDLNYF
jgi:CRP/FNR family transcriptional regulator, cyclic AMP receptor protein